MGSKKKVVLKKSGTALKSGSKKKVKTPIKLTSIGFAVDKTILPKIDAAAKRKGVTRSKFMREVVLARV